MERILARVVVDENGCWRWQGTKLRPPYDYGHMTFRHGEYKLVHRAAYELWRGPIPAKHVIDHLCRVPSCVNPDHLEAVTNRENVTRGHNASMEAYRAGTCINGHPKSESYRKRDGSVAYCRLCRNARRRAA